MIYGKLDDYESMGLASLGGAAAHAVDWIRNLPANPAEGRIALEVEGMYAIIVRYATVTPAESRFETHRKYVDLQYTLAGCEAIEWAPRETLANDGDYDLEKDLLFHHPGTVFGRVIKAAGFFSIYTSVDAHRPKVQVGGFTDAFKLVVKIPVNRFGTQHGGECFSEAPQRLV